jgi:hypothetical protein
MEEEMMQIIGLRSMTVSVKNCARCGRDHDRVNFERFTRPVEIENEIFKYFGMCPQTDEPILMRVEEGEKGITIDVEYRVYEEKTKEG